MNGTQEAKERRKQEVSESLKAYAILRSAFKEAGHNYEIVIARFETLWLDDGTGAPSKKRLPVQPRTSTFVFSTTFREPKKLKPGVYSVANLFIGSGTSARANERLYATCLGCACTVGTDPITATFFLPDQSMVDDVVGDTSKEYSLEEWENATQAALSSLSLRTSDDMVGAARVRVSFVVEDPVKLISNFGREKVLEHRDAVADEARALTDQQKPRSRVSGFFGWLKHLVSGKPQDVDLELLKPTVELTVGEFYPRIRLELATTIRASIRNITAQALYETVDERTRVEEDIKHNMAETLAEYGMRIHRVSAFQFICPAYEQLLERRQKISRRRQGLDDERAEIENKRAAAGIREAYRDIETEEKKKEASSRADVKRHVLREAAATDEIKDQHAAKRKERRLEMEATSRQFERDQRRADEQQAMELQYRKAQMALELHDQMQEAQMDRQLRMLEAYANLPPDRLLQIAMTQNPQLAQAYVAVQQSQAYQDRLDREKEFRDKLVEVYGTNSEHVHTLLLEAAKQLGAVAGKRVEGKGPKALPTSQDSRDLPPPPPATSDSAD